MINTFARTKVLKLNPSEATEFHRQIGPSIEVMHPGLSISLATDGGLELRVSDTCWNSKVYEIANKILEQTFVNKQKG